MGQNALIQCGAIPVMIHWDVLLTWAFCLNDIYIDQGQRKPNEDDKVKRWIHCALFEAIATWLVLKGCICFYEHFPKDLPVYTKRNSETQTILNWQSS